MDFLTLASLWVLVLAFFCHSRVLGLLVGSLSTLLSKAAVISISSISLYSLSIRGIRVTSKSAPQGKAELHIDLISFGIKRQPGHATELVLSIQSVKGRNLSLLVINAEPQGYAGNKKTQAGASETNALRQREATLERVRSILLWFGSYFPVLALKIQDADLRETARISAQTLEWGLRSESANVELRLHHSTFLHDLALSSLLSIQSLVMGLTEAKEDLTAGLAHISVPKINSSFNFAIFDHLVPDIEVDIPSGIRCRSSYTKLKNFLVFQRNESSARGYPERKGSRLTKQRLSSLSFNDPIVSNHEESTMNAATSPDMQSFHTSKGILGTEVPSAFTIFIQSVDFILTDNENVKSSEQFISSELSFQLSLKGVSERSVAKSIMELKIEGSLTEISLSLSDGSCAESFSSGLKVNVALGLYDKMQPLVPDNVSLLDVGIDIDHTSVALEPAMVPWLRRLEEMQFLVAALDSSSSQHSHSSAEKSFIFSEVMNGSFHFHLSGLDVHVYSNRLQGHPDFSQLVAHALIGSTSIGGILSIASHPSGTISGLSTPSATVSSPSPEANRGGTLRCNAMLRITSVSATKLSLKMKLIRGDGDEQEGFEVLVSTTLIHSIASESEEVSVSTASSSSETTTTTWPPSISASLSHTLRLRSSDILFRCNTTDKDNVDDATVQASNREKARTDPYTARINGLDLHLQWLFNHGAPVPDFGILSAILMDCTHCRVNWTPYLHITLAILKIAIEELVNEQFAASKSFGPKSPKQRGSAGVSLQLGSTAGVGAIPSAIGSGSNSPQHCMQHASSFPVEANYSSVPVITRIRAEECIMVFTLSADHSMAISGRGAMLEVLDGKNEVVSSRQTRFSVETAELCADNRTPVLRLSHLNFLNDVQDISPQLQRNGMKAPADCFDIKVESAIFHVEHEVDLSHHVSHIQQQLKAIKLLSPAAKVQRKHGLLVTPLLEKFTISCPRLQFSLDGYDVILFSSSVGAEAENMTKCALLSLKVNDFTATFMNSLHLDRRKHLLEKLRGIDAAAAHLNSSDFDEILGGDISVSMGQTEMFVGRYNEPFVKAAKAQLSGSVIMAEECPSPLYSGESKIIVAGSKDRTFPSSCTSEPQMARIQNNPLPMKVFLSLQTWLEELKVIHGPEIALTLQQLGKAIDRILPKPSTASTDTDSPALTSPEPKPIEWWDKLRYTIHGSCAVNCSNVQVRPLAIDMHRPSHGVLLEVGSAHLVLRPGLTLEATMADVKGSLTLDYRGLNKSVQLLSTSSLHFTVTLRFILAGDGIQHYFHLNGAKLPDCGVVPQLQEMELWTMFKARAVDVAIDAIMAPADNNLEPLDQGQDSTTKYSIPPSSIPEVKQSVSSLSYGDDRGAGCQVSLQWECTAQYLTEAAHRLKAAEEKTTKDLTLLDLCQHITYYIEVEPLHVLWIEDQRVQKAILATTTSCSLYSSMAKSGSKAQFPRSSQDVFDRAGEGTNTPSKSVRRPSLRAEDLIHTAASLANPPSLAADVWMLVSSELQMENVSGYFVRQQHVYGSGAGQNFQENSNIPPPSFTSSLGEKALDPWLAGKSFYESMGGFGEAPQRDPQDQLLFSGDDGRWLLPFAVPKKSGFFVDASMMSMLLGSFQPQDNIHSAARLQHQSEHLHRRPTVTQFPSFNPTPMNTQPIEVKALRLLWTLEVRDEIFNMIEILQHDLATIFAEPGTAGSSVPTHGIKKPSAESAKVENPTASATAFQSTLPHHHRIHRSNSTASDITGISVLDVVEDLEIDALLSIPDPAFTENFSEDFASMESTPHNADERENNQSSRGSRSQGYENAEAPASASLLDLLNQGKLGIPEDRPVTVEDKSHVTVHSPGGNNGSTLQKQGHHATDQNAPISAARSGGTGTKVRDQAKRPKASTHGTFRAVDDLGGASEPMDFRKGDRSIDSGMSLPPLEVKVRDVPSPTSTSSADTESRALPSVPSTSEMSSGAPPGPADRDSYDVLFQGVQVNFMDSGSRSSIVVASKRAKLGYDAQSLSNEVWCFRKHISVSFESLTAHVAPTDVDIGAGTEWLQFDNPVGPANDKASSKSISSQPGRRRESGRDNLTEALGSDSWNSVQMNRQASEKRESFQRKGLLKQILLESSVTCLYTFYDTLSGRSLTDKRDGILAGCVDKLDVSIPDVSFSMDSNQFFQFLTVIKHVLLAPPSRRGHKRRPSATSLDLGAAKEPQALTKTDFLLMADTVNDFLTKQSKERRGQLLKHPVKIIKYHLGKGKWKLIGGSSASHRGSGMDHVEVGFVNFTGKHSFYYDQSTLFVLDVHKAWVNNLKPGPSSIVFKDPVGIITPVITTASSMSRSDPEKKSESLFNIRARGSPPLTVMRKKLNVYDHVEINIFPGVEHMLDIQMTSDIWEILNTYFFTAQDNTPISADLLIGTPSSTSSVPGMDIFQHASLGAGEGSSPVSSIGSFDSYPTDELSTGSPSRQKKKNFMASLKSKKNKLLGKQKKSRNSQGNLDVTGSRKGSVKSDEDDDDDFNESAATTGEILFFRYVRIGKICLRVSSNGFPVNVDRVVLEVDPFVRQRKFWTWEKFVGKVVKHVIWYVTKSTASMGFAKVKTKFLRLSQQDEGFLGEAAKAGKEADQSEHAKRSQMLLGNIKG